MWNLLVRGQLYGDGGNLLVARIMYIGGNDAEAETPVLWPPHAKRWLIGRLWCWEGLGAGGEGDDRWDGWMASLTRWTWVWVNSRSWWWTGRPGVLWSMGSQSWTRLSDWTELIMYINWIYNIIHIKLYNVTSILKRRRKKTEDSGKCPLDLFQI